MRKLTNGVKMNQAKNAELASQILLTYEMALQDNATLGARLNAMFQTVERLGLTSGIEVVKPAERLACTSGG